MYLNKGKDSLCVVWKKTYNVGKLIDDAGDSKNHIKEIRLAYNKLQ